jgi:hypothetical protein
MKQILLAATFSFLFTTSYLAQTVDTFDISTFRTPKGWTKQAGRDAVQFSIEDKDSFCLVTLYKSVPGLGSPKQNFDAAWSTIVSEAVAVSDSPQMGEAETRGDWQILGGFAPFEKSGAKGVALLYTASGYGLMVNALVLTNSQAFEPAVTSFLESISFKKPATVAAAPPPSAGPNGQPSLTGNFWKQGGVRQGMLGHSGLSTGTFSKTYQFFDNGTYKFYREDMQLAAPKYYLENEEGTYKVAGNVLTITPKRSTYSQHRLNKEDAPMKAGNLPLGTVQYNYEFWLHDDNWALLLSPVDGIETKRDGTFSFYRNGEPQRIYQYLLVNAKGQLIR